MNTGGYVLLSSSFLSDSDSIHRNTRMAGDTITTTDEPEAELPEQPAQVEGAPARACGDRGHAVHFAFWRTCSSSMAIARISTKNTTTTAEALPML